MEFHWEFRDDVMGFFHGTGDFIGAPFFYGVYRLFLVDHFILAEELSINRLWSETLLIGFSAAVLWSHSRFTMMKISRL